jgi:hypothetical protein
VEVDDRLVVQGELAAGDTAAQLGLEVQVVARARVVVGVVDRQAPPPA